MLDVLVAYPNERVVNYSSNAIVAGFVLILCVCLLALMVWAGRGERRVRGAEGSTDLRDYDADWLGKRVKISEIAGRYRTTWAAGSLWPSKETHQLPPPPGGGGSFVYTFFWVALGVWLFWTGVFLVFAGAIEEIEVFREDQLLSASICIGVALLLCAAWIVLFRLPFISMIERRFFEEQLQRYRMDARANSDPNVADPTAPFPDPEHGKSQWAWVSFWILVAAWILATVACAQTSAWTLPSEQYGMLIFVAPGFGLFAGWMLYAASVNFGVAYSAGSYPDGVPPVPVEGGKYAYRGSVWPIAVAGIAAIVALAGAEPAHPVPTVVALLLFTPRYWENIAAALLGLLGIALGVYRVWQERQ